MISKYIRLIKKKVNEYETKDINGDIINARKVICRKIAFILIAIFITLFLNDGFPDSFSNYCASVLSILIGLFMTMLVFIADKFPAQDTDEEISAKEKLKKKQLFNFYKRFSFIIGYTIILSIFCLILLLCIIMTNPTFNPFEYSFSTNITKESISLFFVGFLSLLTRFMVIFLLLNIFNYTLLAVASLTNVINLKK